MKDRVLLFDPNSIKPIGLGRFQENIDTYVVWEFAQPFNQYYVARFGSEFKIYDSFKFDSGVVVFEREIGRGSVTGSNLIRLKLDSGRIFDLQSNCNDLPPRFGPLSIGLSLFTQHVYHSL